MWKFLKIPEALSGGLFSSVFGVFFTFGIFVLFAFLPPLLVFMPLDKKMEQYAQEEDFHGKVAKLYHTITPQKALDVWKDLPSGKLKPGDSGYVARSKINANWWALIGYFLVGWLIFITEIFFIIAAGVLLERFSPKLSGIPLLLGFAYYFGLIFLAISK